MAETQTPETPIRRSLRLRLSPRLHVLSPPMQSCVRRLAAQSTFTKQMVEILDRENAPFAVCRWVAWGARLSDRILRLALAIFLKRPSKARSPGRSTSGWDWRPDRERSAAERVFRTTPQHERLVEQGVLLATRQGIVFEHTQKCVTHWDGIWTTLLREMSTLDRKTFHDAVEHNVRTRKKRKSPTFEKVEEPKAKTPLQLAMIDALQTLTRGIVQGEGKSLPQLFELALAETKREAVEATPRPSFRTPKTVKPTKKSVKKRNTNKQRKG